MSGRPLIERLADELAAASVTLHVISIGHGHGKWRDCRHPNCVSARALVDEADAARAVKA